jgi:hypothetical protein
MLFAIGFMVTFLFGHPEVYIVAIRSSASSLRSSRRSPATPAMPVGID